MLSLPENKFDDTDARGLTIDTVSCVNLIIAIGLCVDYSAHIAHGYLVSIFFFILIKVTAPGLVSE